MRIIDLESSEPTDKEIEEFWSIAGLPTLVSSDGKYITMYVWFELDEDGDCSLIVESVWPRYPDKMEFEPHTLNYRHCLGSCANSIHQAQKRSCSNTVRGVQLHSS